MQMAHGRHESETAAVIKVIGEPAIVINGVPTVTPDSTAPAHIGTGNNADPEADPYFGEWLEGRKVRKLFGDQYYFGKVVKYDGENNWYSIAYEDGDCEDLEWHELEDILLPLDITIPLKTLAMERCKLGKTVPESGVKVGRPRKNHTKYETIVAKTPELLQASKSSNAMSHQLSVVKLEESMQKSLEGSKETRKKSRVQTGISQPRKHKTMSNDPQSAESIVTSLVHVPVSYANKLEHARMTNDAADQDASRRQREILKSSMQTARAEKQKRREKSHVQETGSGTQLF